MFADGLGGAQGEFGVDAVAGFAVDFFLDVDFVFEFEVLFLFFVGEVFGVAEVAQLPFEFQDFAVLVAAQLAVGGYGEVAGGVLGEGAACGFDVVGVDEGVGFGADVFPHGFDGFGGVYAGVASGE